MRVSSLIAKLWKGVFVQERPKLEPGSTKPSPAWIQEHVHVAIGEEALQSNIDDICRQWTLSSAPFSTPSQVSVEPAMGLPSGEPGNGQMGIDGAFKKQQHQDQAPALLVGCLSDAGITRRNRPNEDSIFATKGTRLHQAQPQPVGLFLVADGMGGHVYGQEASHLAIQTMIDGVLPRLFTSDELNTADFRKILVDGVQAANRVIYQINRERFTEMGTTITAVLVVDSTAIVVNVGDSRTYLYREAEGLRQVTHDHSLVAYLAESGIIEPDDIYIHPQRNQIYRSLGSKPVMPVDVFTEELQPEDVLLLCSDGLWEMVRDPLIQQILRKAAPPPQVSKELIEAALEGGGTDNISVIVVHICKTTSSREITGQQLQTSPATVEMPDMLQREPKRSSHQ
ncbi:MAG TPA: protein phosphatase 2C domain-containing protein [Ktedonobacteraceae bacterium]